MEKSTVVDRIKSIIDFYDLNQSSFAKEIGVSPMTISSLLSRKTDPSFATILAICSRYNNINLEWLITGDGPMFKTDAGNDTIYTGKNSMNAIYKGVYNKPINTNIGNTTYNNSADKGVSDDVLKPAKETPAQKKEIILLKMQVNKLQKELKDAILLKKENILLKSQVDKLQKELIAEKERLICILTDK